MERRKREGTSYLRWPRFFYFDSASADRQQRVDSATSSPERWEGGTNYCPRQGEWWTVGWPSRLPLKRAPAGGVVRTVTSKRIHSHLGGRAFPDARVLGSHAARGGARPKGRQRKALAFLRNKKIPGDPTLVRNSSRIIIRRGKMRNRASLLSHGQLPRTCPPNFRPGAIVGALIESWVRLSEREREKKIPVAHTKTHRSSDRRRTGPFAVASIGWEK